jgi:hypothetical protein
MNRLGQHFRARLAVVVTGGALVAALFPMAGVALAAPAAPSQPDLAAASDTGISPTDNITKTLTGLVFTGTADVGSTVTIYVAGSTPIGTAATSVSGTYVVTTTAAITDNAVNLITARATASAIEGPASPALTVTTDNLAPTVTNVTSATANATYGAGTVIPITVTFNEVVWVSGIPSLALATTSPASTPVGYTSGNDSNTLTFTYTVAAGNSSLDLDYASTSALSGTIADTAGNAATLTLASPGAATSLGFNKAIVIDTTGPTVTINQASTQSDPTKTSPINFTVVFSATVADFVGTDVTLGGTAGGTLVGAVTGSGTTYNVAVTGMTTSGTVIASLAPGVATNGTHPNAASTSTDNTVTWDVTAPTVTINQAVSQADPTATSPINFSVVFSEPVTGFATGDVTLTFSTAGGSKTGTITGSGTTYNVAVTGMTTAGTVVATIAAGVATDAAGNSNLVSTSADNVVSWDPSAGPTVTINQATGQADPTATSPINFTVTFSAPVTGFDATDVTLASTAGSVYAVVTAASTSVYNVAVYGMSVSGTVIASIAADRAVSITGNHPSLASTSTDNTVTYRVASKFLVTSSTYSPVPGSAVTITAQLADSLGNAVPASGIVVTWSSTNGGSFSTATSTTNASGIATVTFTASTTNGTVHTVSATGGGFTGTSTNITVSAYPTTISLTRSRGMVTYGEPDTFSVQFGTGGAYRPFILEYTSVGVPWTTIANLTTNAAGFASFAYTPTRTGDVRARFLGTTDLGAATSTVYIVGVRQTVSTLSPHHTGTRTISGGTSITFSTTVRPTRADNAPTTVTFRIYRKVGGAWVLAYQRNVLTNTSGVASYTFHWGTSAAGNWYVRAYAPRTPYNSISRYTAREYYLVQ